MNAGVKSAELTGSVADGRALWVANAWGERLAAAGVRSAEDLLDRLEGERLDKPSLPSWRQRLRVELPGLGRCYLKRYAQPPAGVQLRRLASGGLGRSTAAMEWGRIQQLERAGIGTLNGLAMAQRMVGPWERVSAVLLAELGGASLESYAVRHSQRVAKQMIAALADFVGRFHGAGWVHRDLYLCHVFVEWQDAEPSFRLIDLARMFRPRFRGRRWRVKDLAALNYSTPASVATPSDRLRFLKRYLAIGKLDPAGRRLARRIAVKTARIARHDARRRQAEEAAV
ncbi:MAG: lipopolysaccharide kinase InaA family protein [Phycisphaerae bacterium]